MNKREVTELFGVMLLGWPNAEMFKGGISKLGPTIELWSACVADVDFYTGQQAVIMLCKECKFPPTIAEFREKVDKVNIEIANQFFSEMEMFRTRSSFGESPYDLYKELPEGSAMRKAIDSVGGPDKMISDDGVTWRYHEIKSAYISAIKQSDNMGSDAQSKIRG